MVDMIESMDSLDMIKVNSEQLEIIGKWYNDSHRGEIFTTNNLILKKGVIHAENAKARYSFDLSESIYYFGVLYEDYPDVMIFSIDSYKMKNNPYANLDCVSCYIDGKKITDKKTKEWCVDLERIIFSILVYISEYERTVKEVEKTERKPITKAEKRTVNKAKYRENREIKLFKSIYVINDRTLKANKKVSRRKCDYQYTVKGHYRQYEEKTIIDKNGIVRKYKKKKVWVNPGTRNKDKKFAPHKYSI